MDKHRRSWQENLVLVVDILIIAFCYAVSYFIRFDGMPPEKDFALMVKMLPLVLAARMTSLIYFKLHKSIWRYASIKDLNQIIRAITISSAFIVALAMVLHTGHPRSVFIIDWLLLIVSLSGVRFIIRLSRPIRRRMKGENGPRKKVLIVGAGDAGEMILREMLYRYSHDYEVVGLIDDNTQKYKWRIHGVAVLGTRFDIPDIVREKKIDETIIAIPSLETDAMRDIVNYCIKSGVKYKTVPSISDLFNGTVKVNELREVRLEDLLRREEVLLDREKIESYIKGKNVLVSGAGGSIGSELCRQIARLSPQSLILFEKSENALFYIDIELGHISADLLKVPIIGDICDRDRVSEIFTEYKPNIIFHAAAHKHVPLMEANPIEAIKNNVFGTEVIAEEAVRCGAERFIMLSTDKAVDPSSFMGVSKKIAEMLISGLARKNSTRFMTVRFGNVLGSEGSVIPVFKKQIERKGPITVTHPDIKRYFMTIPEAAGLVMEAGFKGDGGETFILNMEMQIKIVDLARDLIRLSGLELDKDIEIVFTGLRPGEKMYESLIAENEKLTKTDHKKIMIAGSQRGNGRDIFEDMKTLKRIVDERNIEMLIKKLEEIVPNYKPTHELLKIPLAKKTKKREVDILIADDEEIIRELLCKFLEGRGYNTFLASNGREALDIIKDNKVDIAIVDIKMPGFTDGFKVLKSIKKLDKDSKVILITGFGTEKTKKLSDDLEAHAYLEKPFDLTDIKKHVEDALC